MSKAKNMAKTKDRSETEFLRGRVRELESEVKQLKRIANRTLKKVRQYESIMGEQESNEDVEKQFPTAPATCPECNSKLDIFIIGVRELRMCTSCSYRKTVKVK